MFQQESATHAEFCIQSNVPAVVFFYTEFPSSPGVRHLSACLAGVRLGLKVDAQQKVASPMISQIDHSSKTSGFKFQQRGDFWFFEAGRWQKADQELVSSFNEGLNQGTVLFRVLIDATNQHILTDAGYHLGGFDKPIVVFCPKKSEAFDPSEKNFRFWQHFIDARREKRAKKKQRQRLIELLAAMTLSDVTVNADYFKVEEHRFKQGTTTLSPEGRTRFLQLHLKSLIPKDIDLVNVQLLQNVMSEVIQMTISASIGVIS